MTNIFAITDENECKYRPCDVFAHCTNTLGSFTCTCFPGYLGDGLHCEGKNLDYALSTFIYFQRNKKCPGATKRFIPID